MFDRDRIIDQLLQMLFELGWTPPTGDVIDMILRGELLTLEASADVCECSDEKIRKACEAATATKHALGIKWAGRWLVGKARLLNMVEQGKLDGRRGKHARLIAEDRAKKYESWARPQQPLAVSELPAPDRSEAPPHTAQLGVLS